VRKIEERVIRLPDDLVEGLIALSEDTQVDVGEHAERALRAYLTDHGHHGALADFAARAQVRFRAALDRLNGLPVL
jgi:hypothetical protein